MSDIITTIKNKANEYLQDAKDVIETMNEVKEWNSSGDIIRNISAITGVLLNVVKAVEVVSSTLKETYSDLQSSDKRDAAAAIIDSFLTLPWYLKLFSKTIISILISLIVETLNKTYGKNWLACLPTTISMEA